MTVLWFHVDRGAADPLTAQVYEQLRGRILRQELKEGARLPSSRELAAAIGVSRNVVLEAYDRLAAEGFLDNRPQRGTFVAAGSSFEGVREAEQARPPMPVAYAHPAAMPAAIDFRAAHPAADHFPRTVWGRLAKEVCLGAPNSLFGYSQPEGVPELRSVLARYLRQARGVRCEPEQIVITTGATQALHLVADLLGRGGAARIAVEDPVTDEMRNIFARAGASVLPVPVDDKGMLPEALSAGETPDFAFVIPSHQFPLGGTLPIQRRIQLLEYARTRDCYLVEDDYDSEFTYEGVAVHSMQGLDPDRVLYVGTFSKILSPALRIGYVVLPPHLVAPYRRLKWLSDRHNAALEQTILARFMEEGYFDRHIRRMKNIYRKRREALVAALRRELPDANILGQAAGMHLVVEFPDIRFTEPLLRRIEREGVRVYPVERYAIRKGRYERHIVMGYGSLTVEAIEEGVARLKRALFAK